MGASGEQRMEIRARLDRLELKVRFIMAVLFLAGLYMVVRSSVQSSVQQATLDRCTGALPPNTDSVHRRLTPICGKGVCCTPCVTGIFRGCWDMPAKLAKHPKACFYILCMI